MSSQSSTPAKSGRSSKSKPRLARSGRTSPPFFTPAMQDAQARNKNPYASDSSDSPWQGAGKNFDIYGNDSYEMIQKRREAAIVLDSPELLMMHAQARNDSIPGTRQYFTKMLCGYLGETDIYEASRVPPKEKEPSRDTEVEKAKLKNKGKSSKS